MILSTWITLLYVYLLIASLKELVDQFEPAVFGVCVSAVIYLIIWLGQRMFGSSMPQPASP